MLPTGDVYKIKPCGPMIESWYVDSWAYVTRYSKRYLKSLPLVSDLQLLEVNQ